MIMKKIIYPTIMILMFIMTACTFPGPYDNWEVDHADYRIVLLVHPDDADILLDGKIIGSAYEFASANAPLRLHSRNHELVIKKEGYREELIDLTEYSTPDITIRLNLLAEKPYYRTPVKKSEGFENEPGTPEPEYKPVPKTEPIKEPPLKMEDEDEENIQVELVNVSVKIKPAEAAIYLNGKFWGISPESGTINNLRLEPGKYTLEVIKPGYQSFKKELDVKDKEVTLSIKLEK